MRGLAVAVAFAMIFSLCLQEGGETSAALTAHPDAETGMLRGLVTDDSLSPLEGARANLTGPVTREATTDPGGAFFLDGLLPGTYTVNVSKAGFAAHVAKADVVAGETLELHATLVAVAVDTSYYATMTEAGVILCGHSQKVPGIWNNTTARGNACVLAAQAGNPDLDRAQIRWFFKFSNSSGYISETVWKPSSSLTKGMDLYWTPLLDDGASTPSFYGGGSWTSPMKARVPIKLVQDQIKKYPTRSCNPAADCMLLTYHYVRGSLLDDSYPVNAGFAYNQRYDVWTSVFYNGDLPATFTVLPPGG